MSKILRPNANVEAFASQSQGTERTVFDSSTQSDDLDLNLNPSFNRGFGVISAVDFPTRQDLNAMGFTLSKMTSYLYQAGVPEWSNSETYYSGNFSTRNGIIYQSVQESNIGNDPIQSSDTGFGFWKEYTSTVNGVMTDYRIPMLGAGDTPAGLVQMDDEYFVYVMNPDLFILLRYDSTVNGLIQVNSTPVDVLGTSGEITKICRMSDRRIGVFNSEGIYAVDFDESGNFAIVGNIFANIVAGDIDVTSVAGPNLLPATSEYIVTYKDQNGSLEVYEFDGSAWINRGVKYSGLTGAVSIASTDRVTDTIVIYEPTTQQLSKLSYTAAQLFDLDGLTSTANFNIQPEILTSGLQNSVMSTSISANKAVSLDTSAPNIFETGNEIDSATVNITSCIMMSKNVAIVYDDSRFQTILFLSQKQAGNVFWRKLSGSGIGFDGTGTAIKSTNIQDALKEVMTQFFWPVGSFFENKFLVEPNAFLGFGTWVMRPGKFIIGVDPSDPDIDQGGKTGGNKTFSTDGHALTVAELPNHGHDIILEWQGNNKASEGAAYTTLAEIAAGDYAKPPQYGPDTRTTELTGGGQEHVHTVTNLPPFYAAYIWERVA